MEFLLPAAQIRNYHPQAGSRLGLNLNLTIQGKQANREAYWPSPKKSGVTAHPERWGTAAAGGIDIYDHQTIDAKSWSRVANGLFVATSESGLLLVAEAVRTAVAFRPPK